MMETKDKTALITGAASGMGAAAARMFAQAGYSVMLADMNGTAVEAAVQGLAASGYEADYTVCDVTDEAQVKAMVEKTVARFGKLDAAYNNAGIMPARVETADTETEAFDHVIAVNLKGVWLCMKYELLQMRRQGHGAIVNTSSIGGLVGSPGRAGYHAAKHGVLGLTKCAALEYAGKGIRVNAVQCGPIRSDMTDQWTDEYRAAVMKKIPLGRLGTPEDVAAGVVFLASDEASWITGCSLNCSGGKYTE